MGTSGALRGRNSGRGVTWCLLVTVPLPRAPEEGGRIAAEGVELEGLEGAVPSQGGSRALLSVHPSLRAGHNQTRTPKTLPSTLRVVGRGGNREPMVIGEGNDHGKPRVSEALCVWKSALALCVAGVVHDTS